jgi:lysine-N-methylase
VKKKIAKWMHNSKGRYDFSRKNFLKLYELELLKEEWFISLKETENLLYNDEQDYAKFCAEFGNWQEENLPDWEIIREQILVYFLFTYFCGAVYDGRIYGKIQMAAASLFYIEQMLMARFVKNEGHLYEDDILDIVYRYSREVEHSDENLERLETLMEKEVWLCANRQ